MICRSIMLAAKPYRFYWASQAVARIVPLMWRFLIRKKRGCTRKIIFAKSAFLSRLNIGTLLNASLLASAISDHGKDVFYFVDIGANAGLYTLFARAATLAANKTFAGASIEPDQEMRARAKFNFAASHADDDIKIYPFAVAAENGPVRFSVNKDNRGMSRIDETGDHEVEARTLLTIVEDAGLPRIDGLKVDIEGREFPALSAFFSAAPENLWPSFVVLETSHEAGSENASQLFEDRHYRLLAKTKLNSVYVR